MIGLTFIIFSFLYGKSNMDTLKNIREDGVAVSSYLEFGTMEIEDKIRSHLFVERVGKEKFAGNIFFNDQKICTCIATDDFTFETMIKPAYTNVIGSYPQNANEIMITDPSIGMKIDLEFYWNSLSKEMSNDNQFFIMMALIAMCILIPFILYGRHSRVSISLQIKQIVE